jgi:hypothetical protein
MYVVIRYCNYQNEVSFTIIKKLFTILKNADKYAFKCAQDHFGEENVVKGVGKKWDDFNSLTYGYTRRNGYDQYLYTVMEISDHEFNS